VPYGAARRVKPQQVPVYLTEAQGVSTRLAWALCTESLSPLKLGVDCLRRYTTMAIAFSSTPVRLVASGQHLVTSSFRGSGVSSRRLAAARRRSRGQLSIHASAREPGPRKSRSLGLVISDANTAYALAEKPSWCQPWTIVLTGSGACVVSIALFRGSFVPLAVVVNAGVFAWWYVFLVLFPVSVLASEKRDR
jgi:hypothetical protein